MEREIDRLFRALTESFLDPIRVQRDEQIYQPDSICGYTLSIDSDGRPTVQSCCESHADEGVREPLVDTIVDEKAGTAKLVAEMPGVEREDINVTVERKHLSIGAERNGKKYHARVPLRHRINEDSVKASYKNGILEATFELLADAPKGKKVEVQ